MSESSDEEDFQQHTSWMREEEVEEKVKEEGEAGMGGKGVLKMLCRRWQKAHPQGKWRMMFTSLRLLLLMKIMAGAYLNPPGMPSPNLRLPSPSADRPAVQTLQIQEVITCLHSIAQFSHHLHPVSFPRYILAGTRPGDLSKY